MLHAATPAGVLAVVIVFFGASRDVRGVYVRAAALALVAAGAAVEAAIAAFCAANRLPSVAVCAAVSVCAGCAAWYFLYAYEQAPTRQATPTTATTTFRAVPIVSSETLGTISGAT